MWFVFKAPQRQFGFFTLINDIKGIALYVYFRFRPAKKLKPVSICTGIYNRSDMYLKSVIKSLGRAEHQELIELSVVDCNSTDMIDFENEIRSQWKGKLCFSRISKSFTRAFSFNRATEQATNNIVFICDADMLLPTNIVQLCNQFVAQNRVWYPIIFTLYKNTPAIESAENGFWMIHSGKGMLACLKSDFERIGKLDESFTTWGAEDDNLWERFMKAGFVVIRNKQKGLIHQWHESFNPLSKT